MLTCDAARRRRRARVLGLCQSSMQEESRRVFTTPLRAGPSLGTPVAPRRALAFSPGPRARQVSIEDDEAPAPPTEPSLLLAATAAPMPISSRREAGIAKHVSVDSEDEDDWGHFSFEDGDAPPSSLENYRWN